MGAIDNSLDNILAQIGDFGKYQILTFSLVCLGVILHSGVHIAYVFTARDVSYRCVVPDCDNNGYFEQSWLQNAVPFTDNGPSKCLRYFKNTTGNCSASEFSATTTKCNNFVYRTREYTILQEYNLQCEDNLWKLTLVGTINNVGQFFGLFISGIFSDKFGRKVVFIWGMALCGVCGLLRTLSPSYIWFLIFEFLDAGFGAGSYICGFIIGVELVGPKKRVLTGTLISSCYALGEIFAAGSAWFFQDWRQVIYILYGPTLLLVTYIWLIPESIRWNLSKGRSEEAIYTIKRASQINGKEISSASLEELQIVPDAEASHSYSQFFKSRSLVLRLVNCCFCWITCAFLFYGLTLNSVSLNENPFLNFILSALVEIPAYFACVYIMNKWGRKWSLSTTFFLTGICCLLFFFTPKSATVESLTIYFIGKFAATAAFTIAYVITSEMFPTQYRHSMMGICSTFGRIGSMVAPQTPLLAQIWEPLPILLYAVMATLAGAFAMLFPETLNLKLPDTIEEAIKIGDNKQGEKEDKREKTSKL